MLARAVRQSANVFALKVMGNFLKKEVFWKTIIWRLLVSIPVSLVLNYLYYNSFAMSITFTVLSNLVGYSIHIIFEEHWKTLWPFIIKISHGRLK